MTIDRPDASRVPALKALWREAFGDGEEFLTLFFGKAFSPRRSMVAREGDEVLGALYWFDCFCGGERLAYLYAVATAKAHRGQGICPRLMETTHALLASEDYGGSLLVPAETSLFDYYAAMGYRVCASVSELKCGAGEEAAPLRALSAQEYAALRRAFLPEGGVVQEGESLALLEGMGQFYAGDGFLLCAAGEDGKVFGAELLGSTAAAPGIVRALGCGEGRFRTPGEGRPFAMYRPITAPAPTYFGLAME